MIGKMGLIESRHGGKTFAQLYAALALRHFGIDLDHNAVCRAWVPGKRRLALLARSRPFLQSPEHEVINLPENYFGVASRVRR